ncbi:PocR ligand-binding domain-containing protein [Lachnotalea glycerini]|uniref:Chemotaxis protein n=1 Tax=Lachnotalea glycerini TaxID=1763509 RepID=A0A371J9S4_9FIRM|nr:PocR ligand-binding domain-containing protein [Lachnotalea glycerini]RDY29520.1 chemotaxis protein [Lachnotalea glycerini]
MNSRTESKNNDDLSNVKVMDVIDLNTLQKFLDNFAESMGIASVAVDMDGNPLTKPSSYTKICDKLIHSTKIGDDRCAVSHKRGGEEAAKAGKPYIYKCHAGLIDFAAPIMINGVQIGTILGGQILTSQPKSDEFKKTAREIGVDEEQYFEAAKEVQITTEAKLKSAAEVLFLIANSLSQIGYQKMKLKNMSSDLLESFTQISATMQELAASSVSVNENQILLNKEIQNVSERSNQINTILESIKNIADQTKMLGLNAAIEAARAGEHGRGFSVVATEIRNLSQNSKETAMDIVNLTREIQNSVNKTLDISNSTMENAEQQSAGIEETTASVEEVLALTNELYTMASDN